MARITPGEVQSLLKARADALIARDINAVAALLSEDFQQCHASGVVHSKADVIVALTQAQPLIYHAIDYSNVDVRIYEETAIARGDVDIFETRSGGRGDLRPSLRFINVWCKEGDGKWRLVHIQTANKPAAPQ